MIKSAKPARANNDAASSKNSLEVGERFGAFRLASSRITSSVPATANKIGQRGLSFEAGVGGSGRIPTYNVGPTGKRDDLCDTLLVR